MTLRRQLALFDVEPRPQPLSEDPIEPAPAVPESATEQLELFAERARLARELDAALAQGDFACARDVRREFEDLYGPSRESAALGFLDELAQELASPLPEVAVPAWHEVALGLGRHLRLRRLVTDGVLGRLADSYAAAALLSHAADALPELAETLARRAPEGEAQARQLARDALLAGRLVDPRDFAWDEAMVDLLAEDEEPRWLASLGLVRRMWRAPQPAPADLDAVREPFVTPESPDAAALAFWSCLLVAEHVRDDEATLHEARRRLKRLRPAFHALYMRRARSRQV